MAMLILFNSNVNVDGIAMLSNWFIAILILLIEILMLVELQCWVIVNCNVNEEA